MWNRTPGIAGIAALASLALALPARAQEWTWPEKPQKLQVFAKDWPGSRLRAPMIGFTRALGVRCSYCHVGEEGQPLSTYDFATDVCRQNRFDSDDKSMLNRQMFSRF